MVKHHSTVSRRDFLKILGMGGIGMGAAAVSAPVIHDLDELMASPQADFKRPGWVKEIDKPTVQINWDMMTPWDGVNAMWMPGAFEKAWGKEKADWFIKLQNANVEKWVKEDKPGYTMRDWALKNASINRYHTFLGEQTSPTPEDMGFPRYEGTPEENARMVRAFLKLHGCSEVSFVELDTNTTEKLIYRTDPLGVPYLIRDVEQPEESLEEGNSYRVIPKKARWVIVYAHRMAEDLNRRAPTFIMNRGAFISYDLQCMIQQWLQNFLRSLGYMCMGWHNIIASLGTTTGLGVMAGLGETCRTMHLVTPEHGQMERVYHAITDLPLAPGKPVDFGVMEFCRTCKKCADFCPCQAISFDTEPSWEPPGFYHRAGVRAWFRDEPKCRAYMYEAGVPGCGICDFVCPFNKYYKASFNSIVRTIQSATPVFNRFLRKMDDFLGYGLKTGEEIEKFWEMDLPPWDYV